MSEYSWNIATQTLNPNNPSICSWFLKTAVISPNQLEHLRVSHLRKLAFLPDFGGFFFVHFRLPWNLQLCGKSKPYWILLLIQLSNCVHSIVKISFQPNIQCIYCTSCLGKVNMFIASLCIKQQTKNMNPLRIHQIASNLYRQMMDKICKIDYQ